MKCNVPAKGQDMTTRNRIVWKFGELAVLSASVAFVSSRDHSRFVCVVGILLLVAWAIVSRMTMFIKSTHRRLISFILVAFMASLTAAVVYYETSPKVLFRTYLAKPIPSSVRILQSEYQGGMDPAVYLHFELSPGDLNPLLAARSYKATPELQSPLPGTPVWWRPQSLENATLYYWQEPQRELPQAAAWLWVSDAKNEAYFTFWTF